MGQGERELVANLPCFRTLTNQNMALRALDCYALSLLGMRENVHLHMRAYGTSCIPSCDAIEPDRMSVLRVDA